MIQLKCNSVKNIKNVFILVGLRSSENFNWTRKGVAKLENTPMLCSKQHGTSVKFIEVILLQYQSIFINSN